MSGDDLHRQITDAVNTALAPFMAQWAEQDRRAADSRGKLYDRMGDVQQETAKLSVHVATAVRDVGEVKAALPGFDSRLRAVESFRNGVTGEHRGVGKVMTKLRNIATLVLAIASAAAAWYAVWRGAK